MLVDPKFQYDLQLMGIFSLIGQGGQPQKIEDGVFLSPSFSFNSYLPKTVDQYFEFGDLGSYGVCDDVSQIKEKYGEWLNDPNLKFCIALTKVSKAEQSERWGWRWHKWGEYIGSKNPKHEYLYDEDDTIQEVFVYHIYQIK